MKYLRRLLRALRYSEEARAVFVVWALWLVCGGWGVRQWEDVEPIPAPPPSCFRGED